MVRPKLELPRDLEIRLWMVEQEHLVKQYDTLRYLAVKHEQELAILSGFMFGIAVVLAIQIYTTWKEHNESN